MRNSIAWVFISIFFYIYSFKSHPPAPIERCSMWAVHCYREYYNGINKVMQTISTSSLWRQSALDHLKRQSALEAPIIKWVGLTSLRQVYRFDIFWMWSRGRVFRRGFLDRRSLCRHGFWLISCCSKWECGFISISTQNFNQIFNQQKI